MDFPSFSSAGCPQNRADVIGWSLLLRTQHGRLRPAGFEPRADLQTSGPYGALGNRFSFVSFGSLGAICNSSWCIGRGPGHPAEYLKAVYTIAFSKPLVEEMLVLRRFGFGSLPSQVACSTRI